MKDYFPSPAASPAHGRRRFGEYLGPGARALLIVAAVILVVGGLALVGFLVVVVASLNSWGSNK